MIRQICRWAHSQRGFTLLELMISMAMMGVIVLITAGALRLGFRSAESGQARIDAVERLRTSISIIESQVQSAMLINITGTEADIDFSQFKGDHTSLQLRSLYSIWGGSKGPVLAAYAVKPENTGGKSLYVTESPIMIPEASREVKLIEGASDIYFEYFSKGPTDEKGSWAEEWTDKENLPARIRLTIKKDGRTLPLIIPLRLGTLGQQLTSVKGPNP